MKEWLCLTCQMQRALAAADSVQPTLMKAQGPPSKVSSAGTAKTDVTNLKKYSIPKEEAEVTDKAQGAPQKKMDVLKTSASLTSKEETTADSGPAKEEKYSLLCAEGVLKSYVLQSKEVRPVVPDIKQQMPTQGHPITTDKTSPPPQNPLKKEEKLETIKISADQLVKPIEKVQESQAKVPEKKNLIVEVKDYDKEKTLVEKIPDQHQEVQASPTGQKEDVKGQIEFKTPKDSQSSPKMAQAACPLCKVELNIDSKNLPNFNTCTDCKTTVCNKCGFSPMPNIAKVNKNMFSF